MKNFSRQSLKCYKLCTFTQKIFSIHSHGNLTNVIAIIATTKFQKISHDTYNQTATIRETFVKVRIYTNIRGLHRILLRFRASCKLHGLFQTKAPFHEIPNRTVGFFGSRCPGIRQFSAITFRLINEHTRPHGLSVSGNRSENNVSVCLLISDCSRV